MTQPSIYLSVYFRSIHIKEKMAQSETKVIKKQSADVAVDGTVIERESQSVETTAGTKTVVANVIWYVYGLISIVLGLRFALRLFGANSANPFVSLIYAISGLLYAPFRTIFGTAAIDAGSTTVVFEPSVLIAIALYGLIAYGIAKLLTLNERSSL